MPKSSNLHNTRLLLNNYTRFKQHVNNATYSSDEIEDIEIGFEGLDLDDKRDTYIYSILRTKERTAVMVEHVDRLLEVYRLEAEDKNNHEQMCRYKIIYNRYIKDNKESIVKLSLKLQMSQATVYRYETRAIEELAVLFFGVDAVCIVS